jgi:hypothetical protein
MKGATGMSTPASEVSDPGQDKRKVKRAVIQAVETDDSIKARLEAAEAAQTRSRVVILAMTVASLMIGVASYNAYLSYDSRWVLEMAADLDTKPEAWEQKGPDGQPVPLTARAFKAAPKGREVPEILTEAALKSWIDSRSVSVSFLGIRASIDDAPVLGTLALFVISLWLLLAVRRENHTIGFLLRDTQFPEGPDKKLGRRWLIFHAIVSGTLFTNFNKSFRPIATLRGPNATDASETSHPRLRKSLGVLFPIITGFVFFLPVLVSRLAIALDRLSYYNRSPFSPTLQLPSPASSNRFFAPSLWTFAVFFLLRLLSCWVGFRHARGTEAIIDAYIKQIKDELDEEAKKAEKAGAGGGLPPSAEGPLGPSKGAT